MTSSPRATAAVCRQTRCGIARGRAGWRGFFVQSLFVAALALDGYGDRGPNAPRQPETQRITSGFRVSFWRTLAGFDVGSSLIPYIRSRSL